ncbi:unnamed protein product [Pleuronectes platessa]|uniref:Uncharacterized protein n=1 Tax=Pleuronectes platessa TaxID=8262 RepID=A0A9N7VW75_PLEPL|nr:unnamed protein product [Pleuronectes platessa]
MSSERQGDVLTLLRLMLYRRKGPGTQHNVLSVGDVVVNEKASVEVLSSLCREIQTDRRVKRVSCRAAAAAAEALLLRGCDLDNQEELERLQALEPLQLQQCQEGWPGLQVGPYECPAEAAQSRGAGVMLCHPPLQVHQSRSIRVRVLTRCRKLRAERQHWDIYPC